MSADLTPQKARGAFFTPDEICTYIVEWAVQSPNDCVLEPSCGEAAFLLHAGQRLRALGADVSANGSAQLHGIELHAPSAARATALLRSHGIRADIETSDFFDVLPTPRYNAVIGNPPYIRYQQFTGDVRAKSMAIALQYGVRLNGLASSWAAFVVYASQFLTAGGRMGLVLPAELLTVKYAAEIRRFLLQRFASVKLITFEKLVFPGVLEEVVLLLAEGIGPADRFEVYQARDLADLRKLDSRNWTWFAPETHDKWTPALVSPAAFDVYQELAARPEFCTLLDWGETYLGAVTGNNRYFTMTRAQVAESGLDERDTLRISPPGSRHLRGLTFSADAWRRMAADNQACYLFYPRPGACSSSAAAYIEAGEAAGVDQGYKCRNRKPWWRVPLVAVPDLFLTYMDHDRPRLISNEANVALLNSLYGVKLADRHRDLGRAQLPIGALNSLSLLSAEMTGRAYGGGILKLEPREADRLAVPAPALLQAVERELTLVRAQLAVALRNNRLKDAVTIIDRILLQDCLGLHERDIRALRDARDILFHRRTSRGRTHGSNQ
jgi:adenine-specific DNA-methyltransferase